MNYYESLRQYYQNGCVLHPGKPPVWGEVGYEEYMKKLISDMDINPGDTIKVEEKWSHGTIHKYEGIVLHIYDDRIYMLSQGKTVWKNKSNRKGIIIKYITSIEKIKNAKPDFDIYKADPDYKFMQEHKNEDDEFWKSIEEKRITRFKERIASDFPQVDIEKTVILWMLFDFCWNYSNGIVQNAEVNIIKKNGYSISFPKYNNKHIYPNRSYYSCCGVTNTDKEADGILLFFDSYEELEEIRLISCTWTVEFDDKKMQFLQMVYPRFVKREGNVYNIACRCTDMGEYERSLYRSSVFSGALEKEYNRAFVRITDTEGEVIMEIMHAKNVVKENLLDAVLCLNSNKLEEVICGLCTDKQEIAEVFIKSTEIKSKGYVWPH